MLKPLSFLISYPKSPDDDGDDDGDNDDDDDATMTTFVRKISNFSLRRHDLFDSKIIKIRTILTIFRPFRILTPLGS